jgi:hypothetical protein
MKKKELRKRISEIVKQLRSINEQDCDLIGPPGRRPRIIDLIEKVEFDKRYKEREKLLDELKRLSSAAKRTDD